MQVTYETIVYIMMCILTYTIPIPAALFPGLLYYAYREQIVRFFRGTKNE